MDLIIVGVGQFGQALARMYERLGQRVFKIEGASVPFSLTPRQAARSVVILCVPTQKVPEVMEQRGALLLQSHCVVSTAKGLIRKTGQTATSFLQTRLKNTPLLALSGPSFAAELKKGHPTALVIAGKHEKIVEAMAERLSTPQLRLYKSFDPLGVELCGALKNVYALAAGMSAGLGFGDNTRAALNTRALAEMSRVTRSLGGNPLTVFGLAGVGDLFLTCSSPQSRNFKFGQGLARGDSPGRLLKKLGTVEGVWTADAARKVCRKRGLRAPLIDTVVAILENRLDPQQALSTLMTRKIRHEFE